MSLLVKKFNPLDLTDDQVIALATGRERVLDLMLSEMKSCLKKGVNHHFILYGPRGIGKSFFTRLLKAYHTKNELFKKSLFLQLPEEQENINFASDLLDVISTLLEGGRLVDAQPRWQVSPLQWQTSVKRLKQALKSIKDEKGIEHIFITQENLQVFIPKLDEIENGRLREFLADFDSITLIGSSLRPDLDNDYSKRLFQVFKKIDINPWTSEDFITYYERLAPLHNNTEEQLEKLKKSKNKIKAISKFTGGSPRLAVILSNLIMDKNILDTARLLDGIIDDLTSYYQDITNDIPQKSKILFDMLIRKGENMTQSALAASFDPPLDQSTIARSFSWLTENYYVESNKLKKGNTKLYFIRDRLYVLYYQKRMIYADVPFTFIGLFVDFLTEYYTIEEQREEIAKLDLEHEYCGPVLDSYAKKLSIKIDGISNSEELISTIINKLQNDLDSDNNKNKLLETQLSILGIKHLENQDYISALNIFKKLINSHPKNIKYLAAIGTCYMNLKKHKEAIIIFQKIIRIDPKSTISYFQLSYTYFRSNSYDLAIEYAKKAIKLEPENNMVNNLLALIYIEKKDYKNIIEILTKMIKIEQLNFSSYNFLALAYEEEKDYNNAELYYEKAILYNENDSLSFYSLGKIYLDKKEIKKGLEYVRRAIEIDPDSKDYLFEYCSFIIESNLLAEIPKLKLDVIYYTSGFSFSLFEYIKSREEKFYHILRVIREIENYKEIHKYGLIYTLLIYIWKNNEFELINQLIAELRIDNEEESITNIFDAFDYLINQNKKDINELHPEVKILVESILKNNSFANNFKR